MKQKIIEALTTKFGVDAKMVEGIAEKLSKTVTTDEELATTIEGVTFQQVLESYADKRANEASETARKNAIKKYESQYGLKDGKPVEDPNKKDPEPDPNKKDPADPPKPTNPPKNNLPEEVQEALNQLKESNATLLAQVTKLTGEITSIRAKDKAVTRRSKLNAVIEKLTDKQKKPYARLTLDEMSDEDFDTFLEEVKADATEMVADNEKQAKALEAATKRPTIGGIPQPDGKATDKELDDVMKGIH